MGGPLLEFEVLGRKTIEVKCHFHQFVSRAHTTKHALVSQLYSIIGWDKPLEIMDFGLNMVMYFQTE